MVSRAGAAGCAACPRCSASCPSSALAEEIDTPGEGQVRALVTVAGNPLVSTPNAARLERAVEGLDFMVAVDIYLNETTRHADVVLPSPDPLARSHYDLALYQFAARNVANYSPAVLERDEGLIEEAEIFLRLTGIVTGRGRMRPRGDRRRGDRRARRPRDRHRGGAIEGRDAGEIIAALEPRRGADRVLDLLLRTGAYGDGFGARPDGLTLERLEDEPHGVDLGAHESRLPDVLRTRSGKIELAPEAITADVAAAARPARRGRLERRRARDGPDRPPPAAIEQLLDAQPERAGEGQGPLHRARQPSRRRAARPRRRRARRGCARRRARSRPRSRCREEMMPGVVSVPHGWGHDVEGVRLAIAAAHAGVNSNLRGRRVPASMPRAATPS